MGVSENPFARTRSCKQHCTQIVGILLGTPITATPLQRLLSARARASVAAVSQRPFLSTGRSLRPRRCPNWSHYLSLRTTETWLS